MAKLPNKVDELKAVGYIRASKGEQKLTPLTQRETLAAWARQSGIELVEIFEDLGVSGAARLDQRPGMLGALDALTEHKAGWLVVAKRDRLTRDVLTGAMIERLAFRVGAQVAAADGAGNGEGPEAQLMRRLLDVFAEYERAIISARTKAILASKKRRGERTGGIPYGYCLEEDGKHLVANQEEQEIIKEAAKLKATGLSLRKVGDELDRQGKRPRGGGEWHAETIKRLLIAAENEASKN